MDKRLLILWLTIFIDLLGFSIFIPVIPYFAKELGASDALVGDAGAVFSLMMFLCSPIWGSISDRYGRRPVIAGAIVLSAISYVIFAHAHTITLLMLSRVLTGIGSGNISAAQAYIGDITEPKDRAKRMGLLGAAFGMGFVFGPPIGGIIYHQFGVEWVGYFAAILCVVNLIGVWLVLPESLKVKDHSKSINLRPIASTFAALKDTRFRDIFLISFIYITAFSMMNVTVSLLWKDKYALTGEQTGYMFSMVGVLSAIGQGGLVGVFQRLLGERKMLIYGCVMVGIGLALIPLVPIMVHDPGGMEGSWSHPFGLTWTFIGLSLVPMALLAFGNACLNPSLLAILSRKAEPHEQGEVMGQNQGFGSLGRIAGPFIGGRVYGWMHAMPFWLGGAIMIGTLALVFDYLRKPGNTPVGSSRPAD